MHVESVRLRSKTKVKIEINDFEIKFILSCKFEIKMN